MLILFDDSLDVGVRLVCGLLCRKDSVASFYKVKKCQTFTVCSLYCNLLARYCIYYYFIGKYDLMDMEII